MEAFAIECLLEDAIRILNKADSHNGGCGCEGLSRDECERLHAIHDELVGLECDDAAMLGRIASHLLPCSKQKVH